MAEQKDAFTLWCDKYLGPRDAREREVARRAYVAGAGANAAVMAEQDVQELDWNANIERKFSDLDRQVAQLTKERDQLAQENARLKAEREQLIADGVIIPE